jgi:ABC-2 type transport system ATP-binding protein
MRPLFKEPNNPEFAVECVDLGRIYNTGSLFKKKRETVALNGLSLKIPRGKVFGVLGPNGAGKTTLVRILSTLLTPTQGKASILGFDVVKQAPEVRKYIGLVLGGERGLYGRLTGRENLLFFASINQLNHRESDKRVDQLLSRVNLSGSANTLVEQYSRGMKQRLHIARGLLTEPSILFLDEPTIGLDPFGALELRQLVPELVGHGTTVILTTHYMFEADTLCHLIAMINKGKLVALGTPTEIKQQFSKINIVEVTIKEPRKGLSEEIAKMDGVERVDSAVEGVFQKLVIQTRMGINLNGRISDIIGKNNIERSATRDPTLEEAYLSILK